MLGITVNKRTNHKLLCTLVLLCSIAICRADRIVLKEGQVITGKIILEKQTQLYIDIGISVLTIPKDKVLEYKYGETAEAGADANDAGTGAASQPVDNASDRLYKTANLKKTTIEKSVDKVSEAVVKISCPGGSGSGF